MEKFSKTFRAPATRFHLDLELLSPNFISEDMNSVLTKIPNDIEIVDIFNAINPDKALGFDGMPASFYRHHCEIIAQDVLRMVKHFFIHTELPQELNKNVSKLLENRLPNILPKVVSSMQYAFVGGRVIQDNSMVVQEILHSMQTKRTKGGHFLLKLDLEKTFDFHDWKFLETVLLKWGFHTTFVGWIIKCVTTSSFSLMLNGSPFASLLSTRGLRQGDPLLPALFIIATNILSRMLVRAKSDKNIIGIWVAHNAPIISHLFFMNYIILVGKASAKKAKGFS
ncbi:uncharacterized protein LOC133785852 [Humulus lupulus]|uniref:uncharacterized protein LOC133785852 n=1 Tax=Humulus lupulus TaxID=3486 RepID=UPI002B4016D8|nr:uncharacterized protein LOC133785852 [Humulus lupulus]